MGTKVYDDAGVQQLRLLGLGGTGIHVDLFGRSDPDQHPISAITGLTAQILDFETRISANELLLINHETRITALEALHPLDFDDIDDVDLTGAADNDLLFRSGGIWIDTAGVLQWSGTQLTINDYTFPAADGSADQILVTDGAGVLTFTNQQISGGLLSAEYRFSTTTTPADPGSGRYRFDTGAFSTVTEIFIDDETDNGVDISNFLGLISRGDRLYFQVKAEADKFVVFDVIADAVDNTGWFTIGVEEVVSGTFFGNNDKCIMIWAVDGDTRPQMPWYLGMSTRLLVTSDFFENAGASSTSMETTGVDGTALSGAFFFSDAAIDKTDHPGHWGMATGITTTFGLCLILSGTNNSFHLGVGGITRFGAWIRVANSLSSAGQRFHLRAGIFVGDLASVILRGVLFEYTDNENGGRWQGITDDATPETVVDTGVTVAINTWYYLEFEVNADGTSVEFFIDGLSVGTSTTNIPQGNTFQLPINIQIFKRTGTLSRQAYVDAYYVYQEIDR